MTTKSDSFESIFNDQKSPKNYNAILMISIVFGFYYGKFLSNSDDTMKLPEISRKRLICKHVQCAGAKKPLLFDPL